jgi:hypothetical protein
MNELAFAEKLLQMVRNYESACGVIYKRVREETGPFSVATLVMDARVDTAWTLGNEIESEIALYRMEVPPAPAEIAEHAMPTIVTKMMWPGPGGAL